VYLANFAELKRVLDIEVMWVENLRMQSFPLGWSR